MRVVACRLAGGRLRLAVQNVGATASLVPRRQLCLLQRVI